MGGWELSGLWSTWVSAGRAVAKRKLSHYRAGFTPVLSGEAPKAGHSVGRGVKPDKRRRPIYKLGCGFCLAASGGACAGLRFRPRRHTRPATQPPAVRPGGTRPAGRAGHTRRHQGAAQGRGDGRKWSARMAWR